MPMRDIVVIGASAGGVQALIDLAHGLPPDFPGAIFVVMHMLPTGRSRLPDILGRSGPLPARAARDGDRIEPGWITTAVPDRHLLVRPGRIELTRGPRENHSRPAVDPLFRSAARAYGPRVIGVVLSGALYDGTAGLMSIKARGGITIVQDPADAVVNGMPQSALRLVDADYVLPAAEIGQALARLAREPAAAGGTAMADSDGEITEVIREDIDQLANDRRPEELTIYTCPDCGGAMWQAREGAATWFRCHVGHAYAPEILLGQKSEELEAALWSCVRLLTEKATLTRQLAVRSAARGELGTQRIAEQAELDARHARVIRDLLTAIPNPGDQAAMIVGSVNEPE